MVSLGFDLNEEEYPQTSFEPVPQGEYTVHIIDENTKLTKSGGEMLVLTWEVLHPERYAGRKIFENLNIFNANQDAERIARERLASIMRAAGLRGISNTEALRFIPLLASVVIKKQEGYEPRNEMGRTIKPAAAACPAAAPAPAARGMTPAPASSWDDDGDSLDFHEWMQPRDGELPEEACLYLTGLQGQFDACHDMAGLANIWNAARAEMMASTTAWTPQDRGALFGAPDGKAYKMYEAAQNRISPPNPGAAGEPIRYISAAVAALEAAQTAAEVKAIYARCVPALQQQEKVAAAYEAAMVRVGG